MNKAPLTEKHNFINDTIFQFKSVLLISKRGIRNAIAPVKKHPKGSQLKGVPSIASSESALWNPSDNKENWILTAGKIENLRIASKQLHSIEVKANQTFSFWKQIENPNFGKGYVVGREVREGCIVPTVAGGLCQLSNALYDAALKANFEILERHKHTKVIKGSLAEQDRDATVKWNYVDLQFRAPFDFRIEIELTAQQLIVTYKSPHKSDGTNEIPKLSRATSVLNDCYSCGNLACYKNADTIAQKQEQSLTTYILDDRWPEFDDYITSQAQSTDYFIVPLKKNAFIKTQRYVWSAALAKRTIATPLAAIKRALLLRLRKKSNVFELSLTLDEKLAKAMVKRIPLATTHLVISQNLLPFIAETGVLGGRTYEVLMTRFPMEKLHQRLDFAFAQHQESPTLNDFRAPQTLIDKENKALNKAQRIITPHIEIAAIFNNKATLLHWKVPNITKPATFGKKILFPASSVGRKGAYELLRLAQELQLELVIEGQAIENNGFWKEVRTTPFNGNLEDIGLILYPTYIEHQPRLLLKAISMGIPVITTTACGIPASENVKVVEIGDYEGLKASLIMNYKL